MRVLSVGFITLIILTAQANASCECLCINGKVEAVCTSSSELKPYCAPRLCPYAPPNLAPAMQNTLPPAGTTSCEMKQVYNEQIKKYEWKRICT